MSQADHKVGSQEWLEYELQVWKRRYNELRREDNRQYRELVTTGRTKFGPHIVQIVETDK